MSIQYIHRVSEKLAPDLGLSEKLPPSPYTCSIQQQCIRETDTETERRSTHTLQTA